MSGDVANPRLWTGADVYFAALGTTAPTNIATALTSTWLAGALGLLGEDGLSEKRDGDTTDRYAWGNILVRRTRSKHKRSFTVVALEDNPNVFALGNPGSSAATVSGVTTRTVKVPVITPVAVLLQLTDGGITKRRVVPKVDAEITGDVVLSETDLAGTEFTFTVYPAANGTLYYDISDDPQWVAP